VVKLLRHEVDQPPPSTAEVNPLPC
jgi:hypothetical protein